MNFYTSQLYLQITWYRIFFDTCVGINKIRVKNVLNKSKVWLLINIILRVHPKCLQKFAGIFECLFRHESHIIYRWRFLPTLFCVFYSFISSSTEQIVRFTCRIHYFFAALYASINIHRSIEIINLKSASEFSQNFYNYGNIPGDQFVLHFTDSTKKYRTLRRVGQVFSSSWCVVYVFLLNWCSGIHKKLTKLIFGNWYWKFSYLEVFISDISCY